MRHPTYAGTPVFALAFFALVLAAPLSASEAASPTDPTWLLAQEGTPSGDVGTERGGSQSLPGAQDMGAESFARMASELSLFAAGAGALAVQRASSDEVRQLGERLAADAAAEEQALTAALDAEGVEASAEETQLAPRQQQLMDQLRDEPDESFDDRFLETQIMAHRQAANVYQSYAEVGEEGPLHDFAADTLGSIRDRLNELTELAGR